MLTKAQNESALVLFKAHYNAKEAANLLDVPYQRMTETYRRFRMMEVSQYDRLTLIPLEELNYFEEAI